jgi:TRAP-type C4-dicarboxylate transport system substrate-binding protein
LRHPLAATSAPEPHHIGGQPDHHHGHHRQENPIANIYFGKLFEVQKYMSLTAHQYSALMLMISETVWQKLSLDQQEAMVKAADEGKWLVRRSTVANEDNQRKEMEAKGMLVNRVDSKPFRDAVAGVYKQFEKVFGQDTVQKVVEAAGAVRAKYPVR